VPPPKKVKQTDALFANVKEVPQQAQADPHSLRLSLDSKATVLIGPSPAAARAAQEPKPWITTSWRTVWSSGSRSRARR
jgi:hypothetical protein